MAINLIPYGQLPSGNYGINLDNTTGEPIAVALEVLNTLPAVADPDNFPGRLIFASDTATVFVYSSVPTQWIPLEGVPATIGLSDGSPINPKPPVVGNEVSGALYWTTDTEVLFVWDGVQWQAVGGRYAVNAKEQVVLGDGVTTAYPMGVGSAVSSELVEVFIDGVRQNSTTVDPTGDYSILGTTIVFVIPPVVNAEVLIRVFESVQISQTARVFESSLVGDGINTSFQTGVAGTQPEAILVSVDGLTQVLGVDYAVTQQDTSIVSIIKAFPADVLAKVITTVDHGIPVAGTVIELDGALESQYVGTFTVATIGPNPDEFEISVLAADPASATPDPILFFSPPFIGDVVEFTVAPLNSASVYIKSLKNLVVAPSTGEANTLAIAGLATGVSIVSPKIGDVLHVKGLVSGSNITIVAVGDDLVITAATGANFENRIGANGGLIAPGDTVSYVGVLDTPIAGPNIVVDLGILGAPSPGRKITIKDEGGQAGTRNIDIVGPFGATFDGTTYTISTNRGSVTLVYDNTNNWNITAEKL